MKKVRAVVDRARCCGYTLCAEACPEVYKLDDQGFAFTSDAPIPPELLEKARQGAEACPERAIALVDVEAGGQ